MHAQLVVHEDLEIDLLRQRLDHDFGLRGIAIVIRDLVDELVGLVVGHRCARGIGERTVGAERVQGAGRRSADNRGRQRRHAAEVVVEHTGDPRSRDREGLTDRGRVEITAGGQTNDKPGRARLTEEPGLEYHQIGRIDSTITVEIRVHIRREENGFHVSQIRGIDRLVVIEIRVADIAVIVTIRIQLDITAGVRDQWTVGIQDAVVQVISYTVAVLVSRIRLLSRGEQGQCSEPRRQQTAALR